MSNSEIHYQSLAISLLPAQQSAAATITSDSLDLAELPNTLPYAIEIVGKTGKDAAGKLSLSLLKSMDNINFVPFDDDDYLPYAIPTSNVRAVDENVTGDNQVLQIGIGRKGFGKMRYIKASAIISDIEAVTVGDLDASVSGAVLPTTRGDGSALEDGDLFLITGTGIIDSVTYTTGEYIKYTLSTTSFAIVADPAVTADMIVDIMAFVIKRHIGVDGVVYPTY